ncbi:MAG: aminoacyl-tRNA hydrolase [Clostridia bacterium]|nr:aminoacyl-tRNA hydrolase [Clostridia bacterium]
MYLIAGLGNPDKKYENTRHNIGFEAVMLLARKHGISLGKSKFKAVYGEGIIAGEKAIISMPQTYMNLSGDSVAEMAAFYKIPPANIIIIHDDISLTPGRLRIRGKGSAGGHNGLKSIIARLGSDEFARIKIGVGAPTHSDYDLADFVLGKFSSEEQKILAPVLENAVDAVECMIKSGIDRAKNKYNS